MATGDGNQTEETRKADERRTVWAFVWTLFAFKIATVAVIFWAAEGSGEAGALLAATTWFWVFIPIFAIAGSVTYFIRVRRVRARRARLLRAEWMLDETAGPAWRLPRSGRTP